MPARALGKTNSAAVYIIPKLIATVIAKPVERRMLTRSPAPQYCESNAEQPEANPKQITFSKKLKREATPMADVASFPSPTTIAVSTSVAHEVRRF